MAEAEDVTTQPILRTDWPPFEIRDLLELKGQTYRVIEILSVKGRGRLVLEMLQDNDVRPAAK